MPEPISVAVVGGGLGGLFFRFLRKGFQHIKRGFDIFASVLLLIPAAPLLLVAIVLIKLTSRGPVFFAQIRVGKNRKLFQIYKLRTMVLNAERKSGPVWAGKSDPRITPVGRFLRKAHLDELPQLFNILRGDMSLIGPRPERPFFVSRLSRKIPGYELRHQVAPGITGLAQVRYRYAATEADARHKLAYDVLYIRNLCWRNELKILWRTLGTITGRNAH